MPPSVLALPPSARTILAGLRLRANSIASPKPRLEALKGSSWPAGRSARPQVLATSTTAVVPSNAMPAGTGWPVGPVTVWRCRVKPAATAASTLPSRPSATSPAVRLPLNLSGAMRVRTVFGAVVLNMSDGFRVGGAAGVVGRRIGIGGFCALRVVVRVRVVAVFDQVIVDVAVAVREDRILAGQRLNSFAVEDAADAVRVQGAVPPGDEQGGDGVAGEVHQGPALGHELVDAEDEHDAGGGDGAERGQGGGQGDEAAAGDACRALGGEQHDRDEAQLLADGQVGVGCLGDVDGGQRKVDGGAVEVEAVARGDHEPDRFLLHTGVLELAHQAREGRFGSGGAQNEQVLLFEVADHLEDVQLQEGHDGPEDHDDEEDRGGVEEGDQPAHAGEGGDAVLADGKGHRAERTQRGGLHDEAQDLEHDPGEALDPVQYGRPDFAHGVQGDTEDHGNEDDLEDVAFHERRGDGGGDDVGQELPPFLVGAGVD